MNRKPRLIDKIADFVTGKGFYLVVLVCVAAIALSGFYLFQSVRGGLTGDEIDQPVSGSAAITVTPPPVSSSRPQVSTSPVTEPTVKPTATPEPTPTATPVPTPAPTPAALVFTWPVNGSVIAPYSVEALAYDETMGDWRTHAGLDIAAALGTQVKATADGTVSAIYQDDLMGTTIEIDHSNGLISVYSNLAEIPTVSVGDAVSTGSILGSVGRTAAAESGRESHLHFAMLQDGKAVNPEDYLP